MSLVDLREVFVVHPSEDGGVAALRGMTLSVEEGEICVVLGPSGAGKSTLVRVVAGLQRPSAGLALVDGFDLGAARASAVARHRSRVVGIRRPALLARAVRRPQRRGARRAAAWPEGRPAGRAPAAGR